MRKRSWLAGVGVGAALGLAGAALAQGTKLWTVSRYDEMERVVELTAIALVTLRRAAQTFGVEPKENK